VLDDRAFIFAQINYLAELVEDAEVDFSLAFFAALADFLVFFFAAFLLDDEAAEELLCEASDELEAFDDSDELVFFDGDSAAVLLLLTSVLFSVAARTGLTPVASRAAATVALPRFFIKRLFFIIRFRIIKLAKS
jgi:hypothetical protein